MIWEHKRPAKAAAAPVATVEVTRTRQAVDTHIPLNQIRYNPANPIPTPGAMLNDMEDIGHFIHRSSNLGQALIIMDHPIQLSSSDAPSFTSFTLSSKSHLPTQLAFCNCHYSRA